MKAPEVRRHKSCLSIFNVLFRFVTLHCFIVEDMETFCKLMWSVVYTVFFVDLISKERLHCFMSQPLSYIYVNFTCLLIKKKYNLTIFLHACNLSWLAVDALYRSKGLK